jgi:transcriptional regulator GlxA family with amidase domain
MPRRIAMLAVRDAQILDIIGPLEVFSRAARLMSDEGRRGPPAYVVEIVAPRAGRLAMSSGVALIAARGFDAVKGGIDTLLVTGGRGVRPALGDARVLGFIQRMATRVRRLGSVCTGAFLLAEAGLLDGKRATTHWRSAAELATRYPRVTVDPDPIFIRDGRIYTSAGVTAGMDLALALVEEDHGTEVARETARELVMFVQRPGGQSQFSVQLAHQIAQRDPIASLQAWLPDHLDRPLPMDALARRTGMSPRNFSRVFTQQVGSTPARYVEQLRLEASRRMLEQTDASTDGIATTCGFGTAESMRRAFVRHLGIAPSAYRARFSSRRRKLA